MTYSHRNTHRKIFYVHKIHSLDLEMQTAINFLVDIITRHINTNITSSY